MKLSIALALAGGTLVFSAARQGPTRDRQLQELVIDAASTAPEFEANALLRIAGSPRVDAAWQRQLIEDAFMRAYGAQEPYRRISAPVPLDSRQAANQIAGSSPLTQVSLQARAVEMLSLIDGSRARELFQWIQPGIVSGTCDDTLAPSIAEYYTALSALARTTYAPADRGEAMRFLEYYLWRAHLPSEMPAVALAVLRFKPKEDEAAYLELVLRFIFEAAGKDPRGFSVADLDIIDRVGQLEDADNEAGITGPHLARVLRNFLREQLTGPRCADSVSEPVAADAFNARIQRNGTIRDGVPRLEGADLRPSRTLRGATIVYYWQTSESRKLQQDFMQLRGNGPQPISFQQRSLPRWREQAERFVVDLDHWNGAREANVRDYFYQKAVLFSEVIGLMPPGRERTLALRAFVEFMRRADVDRVQRTLWFSFVTRLLEFAHEGDRELILGGMQASGQATLSLYARLDRLLPENTRARPGSIGVGLPVAQ